MKNFKNSKTAKFVSGFVGLSVAAMMMGPSLASAATVEELTAQINALLAQVSALQATTGNSTATPAACAYTFAQTLKMGVSSDEVMNLQKVLNMSADTQVAATGVGSKGMETKYFGAMTKAAVVKFQEKYTADILTPNGLTKGTGLVGASSRAKLNAMCTTTTTPTTPTTTGSTTVSGSVSATLDATSPAAGSVIKGASTKVAIFKLTNSGSAAAKVTSVKMKRTGVSSDSTLNNVYLYNGDTRLTDAASVATGMINFSDTAGIVMVPGNSSVMLGVMVEVAVGANVSETVGVMLTDVVADGVAVAGLPISGAQQTVVAAPNGMATVSFGASTLPSSSSNVDPQADYVVWQNTVSVGSRDALLSSIRFRQLGSVSTADLKNFRLMVDGVQVGTAVESVNSNQYVEFTFATPVTMKAGGRTVKMVADIVGGSNKTFAFSVQQSVDAMFWDSQLNVVIAPVTAPSSTTFSALTSATQTVNQGTLTITKATDSPSGNVVLQGTGLTLAKFNVKAAGEKLKIENLRVQVTLASTTVTAKVRNGAIFVNGVQVGSTQDIYEDSNSTATYTQYNLGSSLIVEPGKDVVLEVRGDINNAGTGGEFVANETIVAKVVAQTTNVYKMSSYGYIGNSTVAGNTLTVASGSMTVAKATSFANQTVVIPQTALKIAEFNVTTGSTEALNLNQFTLTFSGSNYVASQLQDVYVTYGAKQTTVKATVASSSNTYSVNENVPANTTMSVKVYATLNAGMATGAVVTTAVAVDATSQASGNAASGSATGQSVTVGTGALTVATDASTPVSALVVGGTMPIVGTYKFTAANDAFTIVDISATTTDSSSIVALIFKDGTSQLGDPQPFNGVTLTKAGLNLVVPANTSKVITVYAQLGSVGTNAAAAGGNIGVTLTSVKYRDSNGVETTDAYAAGVMGNPMFVYKTKPVITNVALPTSVLSNGTQTIYQYTVTADAAGTIAWRQIKFNVATTSVTATGFALYDSANQSTALANTTCTLAGSVVTCVSTQDQEVSGAKTYVLKATTAGATTNSSISVNIPSSGLGYVAPTAAGSVGATSSFIWSDESVVPHTNLTSDWSNDYLVKNLPTDSLTMTK